MKVTPLWTQVTVQLEPEPAPSSVLHVVRQEPLTRRATILAVGPLVTDLTPGLKVLVRPMIGMAIGNDGVVLMPESGVLARLEG